MTSELIANVISAVTIASYVCHLLYKHYRKRTAMCRLIQRFMRDRFLIEQDYLQAYRAMIRRACLENAKEKFRNKG